MARLAPVVQIPRVPAEQPPFGLVRTWHEFVWECWQRRECFVCGQYGWCRHRQPEAESVAMFEATKGRRV
jgi:hypothetical protein